MSCVNDRYSPEELESIFLWDCLCEAIPLTAEERKEINDRDRAYRTGKEPKKTEPKTPVCCAEEAAKKAERKQRELERKREYRKTHRAQTLAYSRAYQAKNREAINERQREYDRAKRASKKAQWIPAQP